MKNTWNEVDRGPQVGNAKEGYTIWKFILDEGFTQVNLPCTGYEVIRMGWFEGKQCAWVLIDLSAECDYTKVEFHAHRFPFLESFKMVLWDYERPFSVDHVDGHTWLYTYRDLCYESEDSMREHEFFATKTGAPIPREVVNEAWEYLGHYGPFIQQELGLYVWWKPEVF